MTHHHRSFLQIFTLLFVLLGASMFYRQEVFAATTCAGTATGSTASSEISSATGSTTATGATTTIDTSTGSTASGTFVGCYYDTIDFTGGAKAMRTDAAIDFDWAEGSPDPAIAPDTFSAYWTGNFSFEAGDYQFLLLADDGVRLFVDDQLILSKWIDQPPTDYAVIHTMTAGQHTIRMEYYEKTERAVAKLSWNRFVTTSCPQNASGAFAACYTGKRAGFPSQPITVVRTDPSIDFDWDADSPDAQLAPDSFHAEWHGTFPFEPGTYDFTATTDDGMKVMIDGVTVLDKLIDQPPTTYTFTQVMSATGSSTHSGTGAITSGTVSIHSGTGTVTGTGSSTGTGSTANGTNMHRIDVEYYEKSGQAVAQLTWERVEETTTMNCPQSTTASGGFSACYKGKNADFPTRSATVVRTDPSIDFDWGSGSPDPGLANDSFHAEWHGTFPFETGDYDFSVTTDDGMKVTIDGVTVFDKLIDQPPTTYTFRKTMHGTGTTTETGTGAVSGTGTTTTGTGTITNNDSHMHTIHVEYYEKSGQAVAKLSWKKHVVINERVCFPENPGDTQWHFCYFDNADLTNLAFADRQTIDALNLDWDTHSPDPTIGSDTFSLRAMRYAYLENGLYHFTVSTDDGVRVWINDQLLLDKWFDQGTTTYSFNYMNEVGTTGPQPRLIKIEYYDKIGEARLKLDWNKM